jgi:hypothetical protein
LELALEEGRREGASRRAAPAAARHFALTASALSTRLGAASTQEKNKVAFSFLCSLAT